MSMREGMAPSDEARAAHMAQLQQTGGQSAWSGWVTFAALMLVLLGAMNGFQGILALFDDGYFIAGTKDQLFAVNYDAWGVLLILWGAILMIVGAGLNARRGWARWMALIVVMLDVLLQIGFFPSMPLLAAGLIALDVLVLFALTARWELGRLGGM